jgi:hypothetical protein
MTMGRDLVTGSCDWDPNSGPDPKSPIDSVITYRIQSGQSRYSTYFGLLSKLKGKTNVVLKIYGDKNDNRRFQPGLDAYRGKALAEAVATFPTTSGSFRVDAKTGIARAFSIGGFVGGSLGDIGDLLG